MARRVRIRIDLSAPLVMDVGKFNRANITAKVTGMVKVMLAQYPCMIDVGEDLEELELKLDGVVVTQDAKKTTKKK